MRGRKHSDDTTAQVRALLLAGEGVMEVARQLGLDHAIVSREKSRLSPDELHELARKKGEVIENLVVDYLITNLRTLRTQAEVAGERTYIEKQPAGELSLLHGVMSDKSFRLLEAVQRASDITGQRQLPA